MRYDVFNGDADGICALIQLRLAQPCKATLVTGVKRDIELLAQVPAQADDQVTVLDISLAKNHDHLVNILNSGAEVFYLDHHQSGDIPKHAKLKTLIDTDANTCTSLLVNQHLQGRFRAWAVAGAFGDNLSAIAMQNASVLDWSDQQLQQIKDLGICINYNSYGNSLSDLHFAPDALYHELVEYVSPLAFIADKPLIYHQLLSGYAEDMNKAADIKPEFSNAAIAAYIMPDSAWSRRVSGVFANELATQHPKKAHAIVTMNPHGGYQVSVRAPLDNKVGADELCSSFAGGGGRKSAAGINHLPKEQLIDFIDAFKKKYPTAH
ncbi:MAG: DHH family phosphoesterase [Methylococcales bacterium]